MVKKFTSLVILITIFFLLSVNQSQAITHDFFKDGVDISGLVPLPEGPSGEYVAVRSDGSITASITFNIDDPTLTLNKISKLYFDFLYKSGNFGEVMNKIVLKGSTAEPSPEGYNAPEFTLVGDLNYLILDRSTTWQTIPNIIDSYAIGLWKYTSDGFNCGGQGYCNESYPRWAEMLGNYFLHSSRIKQITLFFNKEQIIPEAGINIPGGTIFDMNNLVLNDHLWVVSNPNPTPTPTPIIDRYKAIVQCFTDASKLPRYSAREYLYNCLKRYQPYPILQFLSQLLRYFSLSEIYRLKF